MQHATYTTHHAACSIQLMLPATRNASYNASRRRCLCVCAWARARVGARGAALVPHMQHVGPESRRSSLHVRHQPPTNPSFLRVCVGSSERNAPITPSQAAGQHVAAGTQAGLVRSAWVDACRHASVACAASVACSRQGAAGHGADARLPEPRSMGAAVRNPVGAEPTSASIRSRLRCSSSSFRCLRLHASRLQPVHAAVRAR